MEHYQDGSSCVHCNHVVLEWQQEKDNSGHQRVRPACIGTPCYKTLYFKCKSRNTQLFLKKKIIILIHLKKNTFFFLLCCTRQVLRHRFCLIGRARLRRARAFWCKIPAEAAQGATLEAEFCTGANAENEGRRVIALAESCSLGIHDYLWLSFVPRSSVQLLGSLWGHATEMPERVI